GSPLPGIRVAKAPCRLRRNSDRASLAASKSGVGCIGYIPVSHCKISLFWTIIVTRQAGTLRALRRFGNSVTLQPSLHCSLTSLEAHLCGASLDCSPFQPLRFGKQAHAH